VPVGSWTLTARAYDDDGAETISAPVQVSANANVPPAIRIVQPPPGKIFVAGDEVAIAVSATDVDGRVTKVEFYRGTLKLGETTLLPFTFTWRGAPLGVNTVVARAYDHKGAFTDSAPVSFIVQVNTPPAVFVASPSAGAVFYAGDPITIVASATDVEGRVQKIEYYLDALYQSTSYVTPWLGNARTLVPGAHTVRARAFDERDAFADSAAVPITVIPETLPTVAITAPAAGFRSITPDPITLTAVAGDADGAVTQVEFQRNGLRIGIATAPPYAYIWNNPVVGVHNLTALATDNRRNVATSAVVTITVATNTAPTVAIANPAAGAVFTEYDALTVVANASDSDGTINRVLFYQNTDLLGSDTTAPYQMSIAHLPSGVLTYTAQAIDNRGAVTISAPITVFVTVNARPTVALTGPASYSVFIATDPVPLSATAADSDGTVTKVEFYADANKLAEVAAPPYTYTWATPTLGVHLMTARAHDNRAGMTISAARLITIASNTAPSVLIASPTANQVFSLDLAGNLATTITANSSDYDGTVTQVEFFVDNILLGVDTTFPYTMPWVNPASGPHVLTARATDERGGQRTSPPVPVVVRTIIGPYVAIAYPPYGRFYQEGENVRIDMYATDRDADIRNFTLYGNNVLLASTSVATWPHVATWSWSWTLPTPAPGTYTFVATTRDSYDQLATSGAIFVTVIANQDPTCEITLPASGTEITGTQTVHLAARAFDPDGSVGKLEFWIDGNKHSEDTAAPFTGVWVEGTFGWHTLWAKAFDNQGRTATSPMVMFFVGP